MKQFRTIVLHLGATRTWVLLFLAASLSGNSFAEREDSMSLLDESEYRTELEEVVVVGKQPEWRKNMDAKPEWRPTKFELPKNTVKSRIQWFPECTKDERDNYNGVRDRTGENPEFKLFNWRY